MCIHASVCICLVINTDIFFLILQTAIHISSNAYAYHLDLNSKYELKAATAR